MKTVYRLRKKALRCTVRSGTQQKVKTRLERIAFALEHSKFLEYVDDTRYPKFLLIRHFMMGVAKGVGLTIGTALVIALAIWVLQRLISMNIPFLTDRLVDFVQFVKQTAVSVPVPHGITTSSCVDNLSNTANVK